NEAGFEDNHVRDHGIVDRVRVFGDIEILLNNTSCIGEERPMGADSSPILIRLRNIVRADRDEPAVANLDLAMKLNKPFSLPAVLGAEASPAQDKNHWMLSLQFGEFPAFCSVVGKLVVREDGSWNNVRTHKKSSTVIRVRDWTQPIMRTTRKRTLPLC